MRFSKMIYGIASANIILVSVFFFRLSALSPEELKTNPHIDFGFWADYIFWIFLSAACAYLHRIREEFRIEIDRLFPSRDDLGPSVATIVFCDILPTVLLVTLFVRELTWVASSGGPG